jgi:hypothetical protein
MRSGFRGPEGLRFHRRRSVPLAKPKTKAPIGRLAFPGGCEEHARASPGGEQRRQAAALHSRRPTRARRDADITPSMCAGHPPRRTVLLRRQTQEKEAHPGPLRLQSQRKATTARLVLGTEVLGAGRRGYRGNVPVPLLEVRGFVAIVRGSEFYGFTRGQSE